MLGHDLLPSGEFSSLWVVAAGQSQSRGGFAAIDEAAIAFHPHPPLFFPHRVGRRPPGTAKRLLGASGSSAKLGWP